MVTLNPSASGRAAFNRPILASPLSLIRFIRTIQDNAIAPYDQEALEQDLIERKVLWWRSFLVNDPAAIKHVLLDNARNYTKDEIARRILEPGLGRGLLTSEGETWRRDRHIMASSFDRRSMPSYAPVMIHAAESLMAKWEAIPEGGCVDVHEEMKAVTLKIICLSMFSTDSSEIMDLADEGIARYQQAARPSLLDLLGAPRSLTAARRSRRHLLVLYEAIDKLIARRIGGGDVRPDDLLTRMIEARDLQTGAGLSPRELRNQVVTIFMAGHETTALALTWAWYLLSQNREQEEELHSELQSALGGRAPTFDDIVNLRYTRMVIDESMRLFPPAHTLSRMALGVDVLMGREVPAGSTIFIVPWLLHRRPSVWSDPERFDPGRFSPERSSQRHRFSYIPFGAGPRICIGMAFALTEAVLLLSAIAQRYRMRLDPRQVVEPQGLITLRPRYGMRMQLLRR
ncbi:MULTISPECIES: cytochrome P450 [unclassified Bradyrhizobium]|uniref:cytochrome P450 n=1 Tax=unclassified Bradyrhizobium TaxID=2631580 RepID=UPI0028E63027|nr:MULTISPECIES: cytochrome P450 [unclassified Bradyrhizobium]